VDQFALEIVQAFDIGPLPFVQHPSAHHEDVANVLDNLIRAHFLKFGMPFASFLVPSSFYAFPVEVHVLSDVVLIGHFSPILQDFRRSGIKLTPFDVRLVAQLVRMCRNICD
jgi:hypothetical protein